MDKKQTAVDWLSKRTFIPLHELEQAKQMEKEQIMNAYLDGDTDSVDNPSITAEQYYNETYNP